MIALMSGLANDEIMLRLSRTDNTIVVGNDTISSLTTIEVATTLAFTAGIVEVFYRLFVNCLFIEVGSYLLNYRIIKVIAHLIAI